MVVSCKRCGRLHVESAVRFCPECMKESEQVFDEVQEYLKEHKTATLSEVLDNLDVDKELIEALIEDGKLMFSVEASGPECERCGGSITSGQYCMKCKVELLNELSASTLKLQQSRLMQQESRGKGFYSRQ